MKAASIAVTGIVRTHAHSKLMVTPHFTDETPFTKPTPTIEPVIV